MDSVTSLSSTSPLPPCSPNEVSISPGDCVEEGVEKWLEDEALPGFRVWQLAGIVLSVILCITIGLCCCIRFRIPRTKQEIEADYIRKKITSSFRKELAKIDNNEMDDMDLRKALDKVRTSFDTAMCDVQENSRETIDKDPRGGFRARLNAVVTGMRIRFSKRQATETTTMI